MITVYDMTSGTLRKELGDSNNQDQEGATATNMHRDSTIVPELQQQEIELETAVQSNTMPSSLIKCDADQFIEYMK